jgi:Rap1a immunity proteins
LQIFLAAVLVLGQIVPAGATFVDGDTLHDWCLSEEVGDQEACLGYVVGVADALNAAHGRYPAAPSEVCLPEIDAKEAVDAVKQYLLVQPRTGNGIGADLVTAALSESFPCP